MTQNSLVKIKYLVIFAFTVQCVFLVFSSVNAEVIAPPTLEVPIEGIKLTPIEVEKGKVATVPWIGQYLVGIYKYLIGFIAILAGAMLILAGVKRVKSAGNQNEITESNAIVWAAISGLVIGLLGIMGFNLINPETTGVKDIGIMIIKDPPKKGCCTLEVPTAKTKGKCMQATEAECNSKGGTWDKDKFCLNNVCQNLTPERITCMGGIDKTWKPCATKDVPKGYCGHSSDYSFRVCKCETFGLECSTKKICCDGLECVDNKCIKYLPSFCVTKDDYEECITDAKGSGYCFNKICNPCKPAGANWLNNKTECCYEACGEKCDNELGDCKL